MKITKLSQLLQLLKFAQIPHAMLLEGDLSLAAAWAMILANRLLCQSSATANNDHSALCSCKSCKIFAVNNHPDLLVIEQQASINIELARKIIEFSLSKAYLNGYKVVLIKNFENINLAAANALLKTLEEPPKDLNIIFLLVVQNSQGLPATILSRVFKIFIENKEGSKFLSPEAQMMILNDLYEIWISEKIEQLTTVIASWQKLALPELTCFLWEVLRRIICYEQAKDLLPLQQQISPKVAWLLLDSLNYLNKLRILKIPVNYQLFWYNFLITKFTGDNIYATRARS